LPFGEERRVEKTSWGRREISILSTISVIWPSFVMVGCGGSGPGASLWSPRSDLFDGLDFELEVDLFAHHGSAAFERGVPGDAEVVAMDPRSWPRSRPGARPWYSASSVTGRVTPWTVRSPWTRKRAGELPSILVLRNVISG
jgi:hypothetical protein